MTAIQFFSRHRSIVGVVRQKYNYYYFEIEKNNYKGATEI